jgi:hypothetical protein
MLKEKVRKINQTRELASNSSEDHSDLKIHSVNGNSLSNDHEYFVSQFSSELSIKGQCQSDWGDVYLKPDELIFETKSKLPIISTKCLNNRFNFNVSGNPGFITLHAFQKQNEALKEHAYLVEIIPASRIFLLFLFPKDTGPKKTELAVDFSLSVLSPNTENPVEYPIGGKFFKDHKSGIYPSLTPQVVGTKLTFGPIELLSYPGFEKKPQCEFKNIEQSAPEQWTYIVNENDFVVEIHCL